MSNLKKPVSATLLVIMVLTGAWGCASSPGKRTVIGTGVGAAVGAGVGAIVGNQTGKRDKVVAVGAVLGAAIGGTMGHRLDKQAKELAEIAETRRTEHGIVTQLKGDILFDTNKHELRPEAAVNIDKIAAIIKKYPEDRLRIVGHTDSTGNSQINAELSRKRAETVKRRLADAGVPADVITTYGMGETQPVAANSTVEGRQKNRRVEIEITVDESSLPKKQADL